MTETPPGRPPQPPTPPGSPAPAHGDGPTGPSAPTGRTEPRGCPFGFRHHNCDCKPLEATVPEPADPLSGDLRDQIAEALRATFDYQITAEWICCDPPAKGHKLCKQGHAARQMVASLLDEEAPILDAVMPVVEAETAALRQRAEQAERERDEALAAVADEQQRADDRRTELLEERDEALNALADAERERDEALEALAYGAETLRHAEQAERELPPVEHVRGANAEDCPACAGRRDLPYPFICPGTDPTERRPR